MHSLLRCWTVVLVPCFLVTSRAAEVVQIGPGNRDPMQGKEVDWIDGDYVLSNDKIIAVIARPGKKRDANMTVRGVGACVIDLTRRDIQSDQLSCYYPTAGRFKFTDDALVTHGQTDDGAVFWRCESSSAVADGDEVATVEYRLRDGQSKLTVNVHIKSVKGDSVSAADAVRADRTFQFGAIPETTIAYCEDEHHLQTYGFRFMTGTDVPKWSKDRLRQIQFGDAAVDGDSASWTTEVYPASSLVDLFGLTQDAAPQTILVRGAVGDQPRIKLTVLEGDLGTLKLPAVWRSRPDGKSIVHLTAGTYRIRAEAIGHEPNEQTIEVNRSANTHELTLGEASRFVAVISDESGGPIPCKVTLYGVRDSSGKRTADPEFGIDSQAGSVGNCVYSATGRFTRSIPPGAYEVLISRGPEYDAVFKKIEVARGAEVPIEATLNRVVDTTGWVSAELHSHSSPSGDNTSDQLGRVENLVCEHLEFAPCTEHQRIESYDDQLEKLGAERYMATCTGMELTGSLLPINHQNAFPLEWKPNAQDGGGPRTDSDPIAQIARLAMWDDNSEKVVQTNHPNMRQMVHDKNLDGDADGGFSKMLDYMDVIEVHPPEDIFLTDQQLAARKNPDASRMRPWMDLIKSGRRIPGVVNTDAHYNFNGSGWLRNWIRSDTDDPADISTPAMITGLEKGRVIMSTGPFMTVQLHHADLSQPAEIGDDVEISSDPAELAIKVQCPNWLDVNRVEVFVNGEIQPDLSRTRRSHPDAFGSGVIKFDQRLPVALSGNAFVIVAAIGERLELGRIMGHAGRRPPVVVSNPIYVRVGG